MFDKKSGRVRKWENSSTAVLDTELYTLTKSRGRGKGHKARHSRVTNNYYSIFWLISTRSLFINVGKLKTKKQTKKKSENLCSKKWHFDNFWQLTNYVTSKFSSKITVKKQIKQNWWLKKQNKVTNNKQQCKKQRPSSDTTAASFHDYEEEGEVKAAGGGGESGKEVVPLRGKEEKDVAASPTPSSTSLPSFSSKTKNKAHGSCSGTLPTESICLSPPSSFSWTKPHAAVDRQFISNSKPIQNQYNV